MTARLLAAYRRSIYEAAGAVARIGRRSPGVDALLARLGVQAGGFLFVASCSHHVAPGEFAESVIWGLGRAKRDAKLLFQGGAGPDHPIHPQLPESAYLKGMLFQLT